jgi:hypothetical protein
MSANGFCDFLARSSSPACTEVARTIRQATAISMRSGDIFEVQRRRVKQFFDGQLVRSVLVVSRDDFILWARSSKTALRSGLYFKTRDRPPIEISRHSLAAQLKKLGTSSTVREFDANIWFHEPCTEHVILSDQYDFTISLLHFGEAEYRSEETEEPIEDMADRMRRITQGQSWLN